MPNGATWPRWARNAFIAQLIACAVALVAFGILHFAGQANDYEVRRGLAAKLAVTEREVDKLQAQLDERKAKDVELERDLTVLQSRIYNAEVALGIREREE